MADRTKLSELTADDVEDIIRDYYDDIYRYCYWKVKNSFDAQDLTQETFLRFVRNLSDYSERGKPKALLYTIARNLCASWYAKEARQPSALSLSEAGDIISAEAETEKIENKLVLGQCIKTLPAQQQEIILMRYGQELQINEIAKIMGMNRFAVMYRLRSALKALNQSLTEKGGEVFEKTSER